MRYNFNAYFKDFETDRRKDKTTWLMFDALIFGGGAGGLSCALILGSAKEKPFAMEKNIGSSTRYDCSRLYQLLIIKGLTDYIQPHPRAEKEKDLLCVEK